jgi:pimeloyl-ACP methyl ester carboxylesterase
MLGFGFSEKAPANYNTQLWREQIYEFWRTVIGRPVLLVGHSLGALTALAIAATHPDMVEKLVLMTLPATRQELLPPWAQPAVSALEGLFANALVVRSLFHLARQPAVIRAALKTAYTNAALVTDELVQSYVAPTAQRGAARTLCRLSKAATRADYTPNPDRLLTQLHCPVLLLWGEGDRIIPFARAQQLVKSHANLHLISFPKAGHCIYEECADQVNQTILNWQLSTMT